MLIKYIKSVLWIVAKRLSYIEVARCLKVKPIFSYGSINEKFYFVSRRHINVTNYKVGRQIYVVI